MTSAPTGFYAEDDCRLTRRVLRDDDRQAEFDDIGYVTVDLLDEHEVAALREAYLREAARPEGLNPEGAYNDEYAEFSVIHSRPEARRRIFDGLVAVLEPAVDRHLVDYRPLVANFVNKPAGTGVVPAHQNWSVVDERRFQSVSVWVALVDTDLGNGAMQMLPGSHRRLRGRRGMWAYAAFAGIEEPLVRDLLEPVTVRAGQAVILDDAVVHYSAPNAATDDRLAIQYVMVPEEAEALFHQQVGEAEGVLEADVWRVDEGFFFAFWHGDGDPEHGEVVDRVQVPNPPLELATVEALVGRDSMGGSESRGTGVLARLARRLRS